MYVTVKAPEPFVVSLNPLTSFSSPQVFIAAVTSIYFVDQILTLFGPAGG